MGFRHFQGTPKPASVAWKCPTCGVENLGPLEAGCVSCKAGADGQKAQPAVQTPFQAWLGESKGIVLDPVLLNAMERAWEAGVAWAQRATAGAAQVPVVAATPAGGAYLIMVPDDADDAGVSSAPELDDRTVQTLLAALAAYRDNYLAYGVIQGQLAAQEVTELITKLTPKEGQ